jgi:hypothetical protein
MWYLAMGLLGCNSYGDMIPLTPAEEIWDVFCQTWARVIWAFIMAECASFVGSLHEA